MTFTTTPLEDVAELINKVAAQQVEIARLRDTMAVYNADAVRDERLINRLRAALEEYSCPGIGACPVPRMRDGTCEFEASGRLCGQTAHDALANEQLAK